MPVTFDEAIATLQAMFPQWDRSTLELMLQENKNHVENTVDAIFKMEGGGFDVIQTDHSRSHSSENDDFSSPVFAPSGNRQGDYRGTKCRLPADFLQPPSGFKESDETFGDQQLALLLQNEMFQREVESTLGSDFFQRQNRQPTGSPRAPPAGQQGQGNSSDLGIMKGLNGMTGAAKRNLLSIAKQFSRTKDSTRVPESTHLVGAEEFTHNPFRSPDSDEDEPGLVRRVNNPAFEDSQHRSLSPGKSKEKMRKERGIFHDTQSTSAHDILSHPTSP